MSTARQIKFMSSIHQFTGIFTITVRAYKFLMLKIGLFCTAYLVLAVIVQVVGIRMVSEWS